MTYKLNPAIRKIVSPVKMVFPDGSEQSFKSGLEASQAEFDKRYVIHSMSAENSTVVMYLTEVEGPLMNWVGEEAVSFF